MITIYKRGRKWWARGTISGKFMRRPLDTQFQNVALQRAQELERLYDMGLDGRPHQWRQFESEFLNWIQPHVALSTWRKYSFVAGRFGQSLQKQGVANLVQITPSVVVTYISDRMQDIHPKHKTLPGRGGLRSDLRILRRLFNYAKEHKYILDNPVKQPRLNHFSTQTLPFTDDELAVMFADAEVREKPKLRAVMLMLLYTGLRISDIAEMQRSSVHLDTGRIELKAKKNGAILSLPIHAEVRPALIEHLASIGDYDSELKMARTLRRQGRFAKAGMLSRKAASDEARSNSPLLFPTAQGKYDHSLEAKLRRIWRRCGIQNAHAHRFRDTSR